VVEGKPVFLWNLLDLMRVRWEGAEALAPGKHTLEYDFKYEGLGFATLAFTNISGLGRPGTGTFMVDRKVVAAQRLERTVPLTLPWDETFDIGSDTGTPVDDTDYQVPFAFTGTLNKITIDLGASTVSPEAIRLMMEELAKKRDR
jgi:arylsulfatase